MRLYGLIGYPLGHSFSEKYFIEKFMRDGIADCQYLTFPLERIESLPLFLEERPGLRGLNVTIPYKEAVIPYLTRLDPIAAAIGAVNCIRITEESERVGYNTDAEGFRRSLLELIGNERPQALVLGSGGAAKAVVYVLRSIGLEFSIVSRTNQGNTLTYDEVTNEVIAVNHLIINTTPLGMSPNTSSIPALPYEALTSRHFLYDLVYNPPLTRFLQEGKARGAKTKNGEQMLAVQAEESWRIWSAT